MSSAFRNRAPAKTRARSCNGASGASSIRASATTTQRPWWSNGFASSVTWIRADPSPWGPDPIASIGILPV
jgi:hypothetical protein